MKTILRKITLLVVVLILTGCAGKPEAIESTAPVIQPSEESAETEPYPIQAEAYPIQGESISPYPDPGSDQSSTSDTPLVISELTPSATPNPEKDLVIISNVTHSESGLETIIITNISDRVQDINGYSLYIPLTKEHINIFRITLDPGQSFNIYNGSGASDQTDGKVWLDTPILQNTGDEVILLNRPGRVIWTYIYYP